MGCRGVRLSKGAARSESLARDSDAALPRNGIRHRSPPCVCGGSCVDADHQTSAERIVLHGNDVDVAVSREVDGTRK